MKTPTTLSCLPLAVALMLAAVGAQTQPAPAEATAGPRALADAPLAGFRTDLLQLAWRAAAAFPLDPHVQTRSRVQEQVVLACLELDQPLRAQRWAGDIADWRRGACLADFAQYAVEHGDTVAATKALAGAAAIAEDVTNDPRGQEWCRDSILMKVARTYARLGERAKAEQYAARLDPVSGLAFDNGLAATAAGRADLITADNLATELAGMDDLLVNEASGLTWAALVTCVRLFDKFYADGERRDAIEKRVRLVNTKLPPNFKLTALLELVRVSAEHGDTDKALASLRLAQTFFAETDWPADVRAPFEAQIGGLLGRIGRTDEARLLLEQGLASYHEARESFRQTKRADILRPFAEAWHAIGERQRANDVYTLVVEEGMENPNSRPRGEDIAATCVSMAQHGFEPDAALAARLREIVDGLGEPW